MPSRKSRNAHSSSVHGAIAAYPIPSRKHFKSKGLARKVVVIGDSGCGKTSLLDCLKLGEGLATNRLTLENESTGNTIYKRYPSAFESYTSYHNVSSKIHQLAIWDPGAQEQYERHIPLVYLNVQAIILCFSIDDIDSLDNIKHKWVEEVANSCAGIPIIIAGLKNDLRLNELLIGRMDKLRLVTELEGQLVALEIGAKAYIECSSLSGNGVDAVFEAAARAAVAQTQKHARSHCIIF